MNLSWMAWTTGTAIFFSSIFVILIIMTIWTIKVPQAPRLGILRFETTPGDRLFLSLLGSAFICLAWLAMFWCTNLWRNGSLSNLRFWCF